MKSLSLKNFRQFKELNDFELYPITLLVGENNSGKSSIIKAILSLYTFMYPNFSHTNENSYSIHRYDISFLWKEMIQNNRFYFDISNRLKIGSYKRTVYRNELNNIISMKFKDEMDNCIEIEMFYDGNYNEDLEYGTISRLSCYIKQYNIKIESDLVNQKAVVIFNPISKKNENITSQNKDRILKQKEIYKKLITKQYKLELDTTSSTSLRKKSRGNNNVNNNLLVEILHGIESEINHLIDKDKNNSDSELKDLFQFLDNCNRSLEGIYFKRSLLRVFGINGFDLWWEFPFNIDIQRNKETIEYINVNRVIQDGIYSMKDNHNFSCKIVKDFYIDNIHKKQSDFIIKWIKEFEVGEDIEIRNIEGDIIIIYVKDENGYLVNLSDMGTGTTQLVILLLRIAYIKEKQKQYRSGSSYSEKNHYTIIIEEPEQNLHPKLQSKLADFFLSVYKDTKIKFIVETHSEYLIRKSQVLVKKECYKNEKVLEKKCPFAVYYINGNNIEKPFYKMKYRTDGNFSNEFVKGFYDETTTQINDRLKA